MILRARQRFGQYRVVRRLARGGFADVYRAHDTVEGIDVALKIPLVDHVTKRTLESFRDEARLAARLDHPHILPIKTAGMIEGRFVVVTPLGRETLADRMERRLARRKILDYGRQMLEALAFAHRKGVIHCDLKPENLILFEDDQLRLADFGIAKISVRTLQASGSGTIGYLAPEQALGRPSPRSDVFSAGIVLHRMMAGRVPRWPFDRPYPGDDRIAERYHPGFVEVIHRATEIDHRLRWRDGAALLAAYRRLLPRAITRSAGTKRRGTGNGTDWRVLRWRQFRREFGRELETRHTCGKCGGPVSEAMRHCPWCGKARRRHLEAVRYRARCPRCGRGVKSDWKFCPWCCGKAVGPTTNRVWPDESYERRCPSTACARREVLPFMRYCPWCRRRITHRWKIPSSRPRCSGCGWGVVPEYWRFCPWCGDSLRRSPSRRGGR